MASLQDAVCVSVDDPVVSLRSTIGYRVGSSWDQHSEDVRSPLPDGSIRPESLPQDAPFGIPRTDNGNYLWIQHFHSALNKKGPAGFVMANSAADARASEQEIREKIIRAGHVDVMVASGQSPDSHLPAGRTRRVALNQCSLQEGAF